MNRARTVYIGPVAVFQKLEDELGHSVSVDKLHVVGGGEEARLICGKCGRAAINGLSGSWGVALEEPCSANVEVEKVVEEGESKMDSGKQERISP